MTASNAPRLVGPVLNDRDVFEAVREAAEADNPGADIQVEDRGGYFRVVAPGHLVLSRSSLETALGRPFRLSEPEPYLSSFAGRIRNGGEDHIEFYLATEEASRA